MTLPQRVVDQLQAAQTLEDADQAARNQTPPRVQSVADLIAPVAPTVEVAPPPATASAVAVAAERGDIEQKYKSLQGMYASDVKQVKQAQQALDARLAAIEQASPPAQAAQPPVVDPKDVEAFGGDMMEMVQRYVTGAVAALESRIQGLETAFNGVAQDTAQTKEQQFYALMDQLVADWRTVNASEGWLAWLRVKDEVYNLDRQAALNDAFGRLDAQQVAKVFQAYISSVPAAPVQPSMEDQITPDGAGNSAPPAPEAKPILSERAITAFYNDRARGAYAGREAEADAIEAQIDSAVAEGRVSK